MLKPRVIPLSEEQKKKLRDELQREVAAALRVHEVRELRYAEYKRAYKARPAQTIKEFPWHMASNVVVPLVAIGVDSISARLQRSIFATEQIVECKIKNKQWEQLEKPLRDYFDTYLRTDCQQELRTIFFDEPLYGHAFVKPIWEKVERPYHAYDEQGNPVEQTVLDFEGVRWYVIHPADVLYRDGYENWRKLPWVAHRLRLTESELDQKVDDEDWDKDSVERIKKHLTQRHDPDFRASAFAKREPEHSSSEFATVYEVHGKFKVPSELVTNETRWEECIITYCYEANEIVKPLYNFYFGKSRHFVLIPYLVQSHEVEGQGVSEQVQMFQESASASHNQVIDAGTAANCGIIVHSPSVNFGDRQEIWPGKKVVTEDPGKDFQIVNMSQPSPALGAMEQKAIQYAEKRSGVGAYQLGQESPIVGSQATATGTTALIQEGNIRFWVSIDDMRMAIEDLLYLTLQQIQQFAPQGLKLPSGEMLQLPPGDIRSALGLRLAITSEVINKELELRNIQMLIQMLNEYYMRIMQASAVIQNPQFPPLQKAIIIQTMNSSHDLMRRIVERFDLENVDTIVPNLMTTMAQLMGAMNGQSGAGQTPGLSPGNVPPGSGGAAPGPPAANGGGLGPAGGAPPMANGALPV